MINDAIIILSSHHNPNNKVAASIGSFTSINFYLMVKKNTEITGNEFIEGWQRWEWNENMKKEKLN